MAKVFIDEDTCKGCGLCVTACPKHVLAINGQKLNKKGFHPSDAGDSQGCVACAACAKICPDVAISVEK